LGGSAITTARNSLKVRPRSKVACAHIQMQCSDARSLHCTACCTPYAHSSSSSSSCMA
jgi:hypothetical protein